MTIKKEPFCINLTFKALQNTSLSNIELSVILGGLLGDGSLKIHPGYKNARYAFRHSILQKEYFYAKASLLNNLSSPGSIQLQKADGWSREEKLRFCTRALPSLSQIHAITHKGNKLHIQRRWLNHCTAQSLAIWWFDDGSIIGAGRKGCLCTDGFTKEACEILVKYLSVVWGVEARIYPVKNTSKKPQPPLSKSINDLDLLREVCSAKAVNNIKALPLAFRLYLSTNALKKFLTYILPYIPTEKMLYKCTLRYTDVHFQKRWISHLEQYVPKAYLPLSLEKCLGKAVRE